MFQGRCLAVEKEGGKKRKNKRKERKKEKDEGEQMEWFMAHFEIMPKMTFSTLIEI